jgi:hypothetical protein
MKIYNVHERSYHANQEAVGALIDSLAGPRDALWPKDQWPPMAFDAPLGKGARGGHGPVRYAITEYVPGRRVTFTFDGSGLTAGLDGRHFFEVVPRNGHVVLRHVVDAECNAKTWLKWRAVIGPLHDALLEDALDGAELKLHGRVERPASWGLGVKILRRMAQKKRGKGAPTPAGG